MKEFHTFPSKSRYQYRVVVWNVNEETPATGPILPIQPVFDIRRMAGDQPANGACLNDRMVMQVLYFLSNMGKNPNPDIILYEGTQGNTRYQIHEIYGVLDTEEDRVFLFTYATFSNAKGNAQRYDLRYWKKDFSGFYPGVSMDQDEIFDLADGLLLYSKGRNLEFPVLDVKTATENLETYLIKLFVSMHGQYDAQEQEVLTTLQQLLYAKHGTLIDNEKVFQTVFGPKKE